MRNEKVSFVVALLVFCAAMCLIILSARPRETAEPQIVLEGTITYITLSHSGSYHYIEFQQGEELLALTTQNTVVTGSGGSTISAADLRVGQHITATVHPEQFYDPVRTFNICYNITVIE